MVLNLVMMGVMLAANYDKQAMLPALSQVMKNLFHDPADAFYTGRAMDIMFDGVPVDCNSDHKVTQAVCLTLEDSSSFKSFDDQQLKFSLLGGVSI